MNREIVTIETMQADHQGWLAAHEQWRREIERWRAEHASAVARLARLQTALREDDDFLEEHARAFRQTENAVAAHEREIREFVAGTSDKPQDVMAHLHREQEVEFHRQNEAHERIKKHHEAVMAQLQALELTTTESL